MVVSDSAVVAMVRLAMTRFDIRPDARRLHPFHPCTWRRWLGEHVAALDVIDRHAEAGEIGRADLVSYSRQVVGSDEVAMKRLFVATMIWGSGTSNGRGPRYMADALNDGRLDQVLRSSHAAVVHDRSADAYRVFRVRGVGPSFLTKWFWSASLVHSLRPSPLVLDRRVWASLGAVGWNSIEVAGSRRRADRYVAYLEAMERWAGLMPELGSPEALENVLFKWGGR